MVVPNVFRDEVENRIISYDFLDVASATGIILFHGFNSYNGSTRDYHLSRSVVRSERVEESQLSSSASFNFDHDYDFTSFLLPTTIRGDAIITNSCGVNPDGGTGTLTYTATLRKVSTLGVETDIASASDTETITVTSDFNINLKIAIPETNFKIGETLRLNIVLQWTRSTGSQATIWYGHDPIERDGTNLTPSSEDTTTQLKFWCPFKVNL